jgi:AraC-like DNA-binding protein
MQEFYKKALFGLLLLLAVEALLACFLVYRSYPVIHLLPADGDQLRWRYASFVDPVEDGKSAISLKDASTTRLVLDFKLDASARHPFVDAELVVEDEKGRLALADLSKFTSVSFVATCAPSNTMLFGLATFDEALSKPGDFRSYPSAHTYFSCDEKGVPVSLDITRLAIPEWWFDVRKLELAQQRYRLDKVGNFFFGTSARSPRETASRVVISELTLHGRDERYLQALAALVLAGLAAYSVWFVRAHARALSASISRKLKEDLPFVAYRELTLEPDKDSAGTAIVRYIATNYTDPALDLESVASALGVNRNKVNDVLRTVLGMTFTGYLNKLRLTEAARLLLDGSSATVAQIAYSVGYSHVSYFNRLFKEEYGCTPKAFRKLDIPGPSATAPPGENPESRA